MDGSGNPLRPSRAAAVEQWARQSSGTGSGNIRASGAMLPRRGSDSSGIGSGFQQQRLVYGINCRSDIYISKVIFLNLSHTFQDFAKHSILGLTTCYFFIFPFHINFGFIWIEMPPFAISSHIPY